MGHPSGGVIERGCRRAVVEVERATRVAIVGKINMLGIPENNSPQKKQTDEINWEDWAFAVFHGAFISPFCYQQILAISGLEEKWTKRAVRLEESGSFTCT